MRASWHALHAHLVTTSNRLRFQTEFRQIAARHPALAGSAEPAALFDRLHGPGGDPVERNDVLRALVLSAQTREGPAGTATVLLILALWPGLDAVHGRLWRHFRDDPAALTSEIAARITDGIRRLDLARVNRIAATLIRNTERDIRRMLVREARRRHEPLDEAWADDAPEEIAAVRADTARLVARLRASLGADAELVLAIVLRGETRREAARSAGLGHAAARKRFSRALVKLRRHLAA
jgi:RNA polymerase sigma-70 factor (ECF subfamily)